jgi:hypothetical protein
MCCFKRSFGFLQTKAYKSKTKINFSDFFFISKGEAFTYLQRKKQHCICIFILSVLFRSKTETHLTFCSGGPSLGAKLGLPDEFCQKMFPITPPGNGNVGLGPRDLSEFGFKVGENLPPPKKPLAKFRQKIKTTFLGHEFFLLFKLKLQYFVQESAAKFTIFYLL